MRFRALDTCAGGCSLCRYVCLCCRAIAGDFSTDDPQFDGLLPSGVRLFNECIAQLQRGRGGKVHSPLLDPSRAVRFHFVVPPPHHGDDADMALPRVSSSSSGRNKATTGTSHDPWHVFHHGSSEGDDGTLILGTVSSASSSSLGGQHGAGVWLGDATSGVVGPATAMPGAGAGQGATRGGLLQCVPEFVRPVFQINQKDYASIRWRQARLVSPQ